MCTLRKKVALGEEIRFHFRFEYRKCGGLAGIRSEFVEESWALILNRKLTYFGSLVLSNMEKSLCFHSPHLKDYLIWGAFFGNLNYYTVSSTS